jgi:hypothetical protein
MTLAGGDFDDIPLTAALQRVSVLYGVLRLGGLSPATQAGGWQHLLFLAFAVVLVNDLGKLAVKPGNGFLELVTAGYQSLCRSVSDRCLRIFVRVS